MKAWADQLQDVYPNCPKASGNPTYLSLDTIIRDPSAFEGQLVETEGYYSGYFEHSAIYTTPEKGLYNKDFSTGLWVLVPDDSFDGKSVRVTGTITTKIKGHLGQFAGTLCAIDIRES